MFLVSSLRASVESYRFQRVCPPKILSKSKVQYASDFSGTESSARGRWLPGYLEPAPSVRCVQLNINERDYNPE